MGITTDDVRFPPAAATRAPSTVIPRNLTPPASPPLGFDVEAGKDRPAGSSILPHLGANAGENDAVTVSPGISRSNTMIMHELGASTPGAADSEYDPLLLRTKLLGDDEIELRRRNTQSKSKSSSKKVGKYVQYRLYYSAEDQVLTLYRVLHRFYDEQNEHIRDLLKPLSKHADEAREAEESNRLPVRLAAPAPCPLY